MQKSAKDSSKGSGRGAFVVDSRVLNKNVKSFICFFTTRFQRNQPFLSEGFLLQFDSKFSGRTQKHNQNTVLVSVHQNTG